jgi:7-carboxy-7-deazaguanine synthase
VHQLNQQPTEKPTHRTDGIVEIVDVFYTLQGEGPFAGVPAVFVRLAGCNLQCPDCDTDYTTGRRMIGPAALTNEVEAKFPGISSHWPGPRLVVITGGEPFRQEIGAFVRDLLRCGFRVQVETNGSLYLSDFPYAGDVHLVVSPKVGVVHPDLRPYVKHLKYVVEAGRVHEQDKIPLNVLGNNAMVAAPWKGFKGTVWVQPSDQQNDECNKANREAAADACLTKGYRLSHQIHKEYDLK